MLRLREGGPQEGFSTTNVTQNLGKKYSQNLFTAPLSLRSECALRGHLQDITGGKVNMPYPNSLSPCATESVIHLVVPLSILLWEESSWRKLKSLDSKKKKKKCGGLLSEFVWQVPYSWIPTVDMGMTQSSRANRLWTLGRQLSAHFSKLDCISSVKSLILPGVLPLVTDGPRTHFIHLDRGLVIWVGWSQRGSIPRLLYLWSLLSFLPNLLFLQVFIKHPLCVIVASITVLGTRGGGEWAVLTTRNSEGCQ